jgi:UDP-hydrolysing UDP-N-acetyl-D-glucosamine 2-epimerase
MSHAKRRVCAVITARPSYSRIRTALQAIKRDPDVQLQIVVAASALLERYGNAARHIVDDGFTIDARIFIVLEGETPTAMAKSTGLGVLELASVFDNLRPDLVVTIADRYETLATAVAASYMNVPVAHIQGGEVTGSIDEKVRHAVTKLADLHLVSTLGAGERVIRMGEDPATVHVTGCPSIDLATEILDQPALDFDPVHRYGGVGATFDPAEGYVVVMQHPVTTEHCHARAHVWETLVAVQQLGIPAYWFWPNPDAGSDGTSSGIRTFRENDGQTAIRFFKNMQPHDFLRLLWNARCLIGNSSVGIRECSFLGVPVVNIGTRQSGRERGRNVIDVGYDRDAIVGAARAHLRHGRYEQDRLYGDGRAGQRIADHLAHAVLQTEKRLAY